MSYGEVFGLREFRWLWTAQVLSYAGDQFAQVAIAILVFHRTGSPFLTALVYALTYLPPIAGGPLLSGFADLFPRRQVMIVCDLIRMGTVALMAIHGMPFAALCVLLFATVLMGAPFASARSALLPDVLTSEQLPVGSAISNITHQASQILGFVAGAAVVAILNPYRTLGIDAATFCISALIAVIAVKPRPAPSRDPSKKASVWSVSMEGIRLVFGDPSLRTLLLFGWLAGFYIIPEGLAAPYAHSLRGTTYTVGFLMAAMPLGTVVGVMLLSRFVRPDTQIRVMGWLAMGACAPLIGCAWNPPLWVVLSLLAIAGMGGAFQIAAIPAFVQQLRPSTRGSAFGVAQSGLYAVQGIGIAAGGAVASWVGAPIAVSLAGLLGLCAAACLALTWTHLRAKVIAARGLLAALVDEGLGDGGVLTLLGNHRPRDYVHQRPKPVEDREHPEEQPHEIDVEAEVGRQAGAHPRDHPALAAANQLLPRIVVIFSHNSIMPAFGKVRVVDLLHIDDQLTDEERLIRDTVRSFVTDRIMPDIADWFEAGTMPRSVLSEMGKLGLFGMTLTGYGCAGAGPVAYGIACRELEAADSGLRSSASVQGSLAMYPIWRYGSDEQKDEWLPRMAAGEAIGCFGLTEPDRGSDPGGMLTTARRSGADWLLSGTKMWITNGSIADVAVVWARTDSGVRGFLVPRGARGFTARDIHKKMSLRASITSELHFDDVRLPASALLPGVTGLKGPLSCLTEARFGILWGVTGSARSCVAAALSYAQTREQFGKPIGSFQLTQGKLASMAVRLYQAQLLALHLGRLKESAGSLEPVQVSVGKMANVRTAIDIAREARTILGANGVTLEYPVMRHAANLEAVLTYEGTEEIHALAIGQALTGISAYR